MSIAVAGRPRPFGLAEVALAPGVATRAQAQILHLAREFPVDRILAVFRANAGLPTGGALPPGAWEDFGHPHEQPWGPWDYPGRERARTANLLRGHYAGHFLSMLAMAAAGTGEPALHAKVAAIVDGLGEVRQHLAATGRYSHPGYLAAYGEWQYSRLEELAPYGEIWAPYYTAHKILTGLLDAHTYTGNADALDLATGMGEWIDGRLAPLPDEHRQRMWAGYIAGEFGGLGEALVRLAEHSRRPEFVDTARLLDQRHLIDAGVERRDVLDGVHANQHLPQLLSYLRLADHTGDPRYAAAVVGLWDMLVPGRIYAHGGTGESELWGPAGTVAGDIGTRNAETCATYNMVKIARELFCRTEDPRYLDYLERGLLNHIVGSKRDVTSSVSPEVCYMFPVHPGARREYDNIGTCCGGTGLENHVSYQGFVYLHRDGVDGPEIWVTLYLPSRLEWPEREVALTQQTRFPRDGVVHIEVDASGPLTLHLRLPEWAAGGWTASVNGRPIGGVDGGIADEVGVVEGGFLHIHRDWSPGDVVDVELDLPIRTEPTVDDPRLFALRHGPTVLLAESERTTGLSIGLAGARRLDGSIDPRAVEVGVDDRITLAGVTFQPCWSGSDSRYHMYLRCCDPRIAFPGSDSGVANRTDRTGATFLSRLWDRAPFAGRADFLRAAAAVLGRFRSAGLFDRSELAAIQQAVARCDLGRQGEPLAVVLPVGAPGLLPRQVTIGARQLLVRWAAAPDTTQPGVQRILGTIAGDGAVADGAVADGAVADGTVEEVTVAGNGAPGNAAAGAGRAAGGDAALAAVDATVWVVDRAADAWDPPPAVTIGLSPQPAATGWFVEPVTISVSGRSDRPGLRTQVRIDGGPWRSATAPMAVEGDGVHQIEARATDSSGRTAHAACMVSVDLTPPTSVARVRELGSCVEISLDAQDGGSGIDRIQWRAPGTFWATFSEAFTRALTDSEQIVEFTAIDRAGNVEPVRRLVLPAAPGAS